MASVDRANVKNYDFVLVGSPTMGWSATKLVKEFLESFKADEFSGKLGAAFDTRIDSRLSGNATKSIGDGLKKLGFKIAAKDFFIFVEGAHGVKDDYVLKQGQVEKAKAYAEDLAKQLKA